MSVIPDSEVEIKDPSNSEKIRRILFGVLFFILIVGIIGFSWREMKANEEAVKAAELATADKIKNVPEALKATLKDLNDFKESLDKSEFKTTKDIAKILEHISKDIKELHGAKKASIEAAKIAESV